MAAESNRRWAADRIAAARATGSSGSTSTPSSSPSISGTPPTGGHGGKAAGHGLDEHHREVLGQAGQHEQVGLAHQARHLVLWLFAKEDTRSASPARVPGPRDRRGARPPRRCPGWPRGARPGPRAGSRGPSSRPAPPRSAAAARSAAPAAARTRRCPRCWAPPRSSPSSQPAQRALELVADRAHHVGPLEGEPGQPPLAAGDQPAAEAGVVLGHGHQALDALDGRSAAEYTCACTTSGRLRREGWRPDVVHAHVYSAGATGAGLGRLSARGGRDRALHRLRPGLDQRRASARWPGSPSSTPTWWRPSATSWPAHLRAVAPSANLVVVPNTVDTGAFEPTAGPHEGRPRLLNVAALAEKKGHRFLLEAMPTELPGGAPGHRR